MKIKTSIKLLPMQNEATILVKFHLLEVDSLNDLYETWHFKITDLVSMLNKSLISMDFATLTPTSKPEDQDWFNLNPSFLVFCKSEDEALECMTIIKMLS